MPSPPPGACTPGPSFWLDSAVNWWPWWPWWRRPPMASLAGLRSQTLILMVFSCILIFLFLSCFVISESHFRPFTEVVRKIGREVTRKRDGPTVAQRSRHQAEGLRLTRLAAAVADHPRKARRLRVVWRTGCNQQRNRPCAIYFAFLVWDSVRARHTAIAETAVRPSQGRRSRNVMIIVALS